MIYSCSPYSSVVIVELLGNFLDNTVASSNGVVGKFFPVFVGDPDKDEIILDNSKGNNDFQGIPKGF